MEVKKICYAKLFFGIALTIIGVMGCQQAADLLTGANNQVANSGGINPSTQPVILPTPAPTQKPDPVNQVAATVGQVAATVAATTPPGTPVSSGATIIAAIAGLVISANEMLKKLKKNPPT